MIDPLPLHHDFHPFDAMASGKVAALPECFLAGFLVAGKRAFADRSFEDGLPEPAADDRRGNRFRHRKAESACQPGQATISGGDQAFQTRFQHAAQDRRGAAG